MWLWTVSAGAACDPALVDALAAKLGATPAADRVAVAAGGWSGLCSGDGVLDAQLAQIGSAKPESWWLVELQTSLLDPRGWWVACGTATSGESGVALSMATKLDPSQRRAHLWAHCTLARFGAFDEQEWSSGPGLLVMPLLAASTLQGGGIPAAQARPVVRALAGL